MKTSHYTQKFHNNETVRCLIVWKDSLWSGSGDGTIKQWNAHGHCINTLQGHSGVVYCLLVWRDFLYSSSLDTTIRVWNSKGECVRVLQGHTGKVLELAVWRDSIVSCAWNFHNRRG